MQPISDFDERFQILRSLVRRKELPEDWYTDDAYSVAFNGSDSQVNKVTITITRDDHLTIREYEPMKQGEDSESMGVFMLKTSEVQHKTAEPL